MKCGRPGDLSLLIFLHPQSYLNNMKIDSLKILIFILLCIYTVSCTSSIKQSDFQFVVGRIYVIGNEPFLQLGIEDEQKKIHIISTKSIVYDELWDVQLKRVELKCIVNDTGELIVTEFKILEK